MTTAQKRRLRVEREALESAAREWADLVESQDDWPVRGSADVLSAGARLRLAARRFRAAEREASS